MPSVACMPLAGVSTSYPYGKGKISGLNTLLAQDFPDVLGDSEVDTTHTHLVEATKFVHCIVSFQGHQWGQPASNSSPRRRRKTPK